MFDLKEFLLLPTWIGLHLLRLVALPGNPLKNMKIGSFSSWSREASDTCVVFGAFVLLSMASFTPVIYKLFVLVFRNLVY